MKTSFWKRIKQEVMSQNYSKFGGHRTFVARKNMVLNRIKKDPKYRAKIFKGLDTPGLIQQPKNLAPFYVPKKVD